MLIKVLLIIFKNWKQTTWHLIDEWYILFYLNNTYYISPLLFSLHKYHHGLPNQYFPLNRVNKYLKCLFFMLNWQYLFSIHWNVIWWLMAQCLGALGVFEKNLHSRYPINFYGLHRNFMHVMYIQMDTHTNRQMNEWINK